MPNRNSFKTRKEWLDWYRIYRKKNAEKFREYNREYNRIWRRDFGYENETNSKDRYPEKETARKLLRYAVRLGFLKIRNCEVCNSNKSQAHHLDYNKPLEVIWFCPLHHAEIHKSIKLST